MLNVFTVSFFGHRDFCNHYSAEKKLEKILKDLLTSNEYVDFLIGRNGEFDKYAASSVLRVKREFGSSNSSLVLILPYSYSEILNNTMSFKNYYDEIRINENANKAHYKASIKIRNREMIDCSDLIICYVERNTGGAYEAMQYAKKQGKTVINLAGGEL